MSFLLNANPVKIPLWSVIESYSGVSSIVSLFVLETREILNKPSGTPPAANSLLEIFQYSSSVTFPLKLPVPPAFASPTGALNSKVSPGVLDKPTDGINP